MSQLRKKFSSDELKNLFDRYLQNEVQRKYIQDILRIKKNRFFLLLKQYKETLWSSRFNIKERSSMSHLSRDRTEYP